MKKYFGTVILLMPVLFVAVETYGDPNPQCVINDNFDSLPDTVWDSHNGTVPGDTIIHKNDIDVIIETFTPENGPPVFVYSWCHASIPEFGFGAGKVIEIFNSDLKFTFGSTVNFISFQFLHLEGSIENIAVNDHSILIGNLVSEQGQIDPDAILLVQNIEDIFNGDRKIGIKATVILKGQINSLLVGGQLFLDDFCACIGNGDVNNDGGLTFEDARCAYNISLGAGQLPADCDLPGFDCELAAADVNCDNVVTFADALAIYQRAQSGLPPAACFARSAFGKLNTQAQHRQLSLTQHNIVQLSEITQKELVRFSLKVDNAAGVAAFGLTLSYPAHKLEFIGIERTELTAKWEQLEGRSTVPGTVTIGGFDDEPLAAGAAHLFHILFAAKSQPISPTDLEISQLVDDFSNAEVRVAATEAESMTSVPSSFKLYQNFPNPFQNRIPGSQTMIRFDLPGTEAIKVELAVYNLAGQLVRLLVFGAKPPGACEITWDGKDEQGQHVPSGIYLYHLKAGSLVESKRLAVIW